MVRNLELVLPEDLQDSLRLLRPEGNLLRDHMAKAVAKGIVEYRKPLSQPKKPMRSTTEKWTYKDFKI